MNIIATVAVCMKDNSWHEEYVEIDAGSFIEPENPTDGEMVEAASEIIETMARRQQGVVTVGILSWVREGENLVVEDVWSEDQEYPRSAWVEQVTNNDTNLGYWEWVSHSREIQTNETKED